MARPRLKHLGIAALLVLAAAALVACGGREIELDSADARNVRLQQGAVLFYERCSGCHTLDTAAAEGSAVNVRDRERVDGPNFNVRPEQRDAVLYAIRNGGFSGAIMPENIVVGEQAEAVADFLAKYAGRDAERPVTPNSGQQSQSP
jgi:mono/diheme cytochrome c family protein